MIQRAHFVEDKEAIIRLWQQCFGDERHYVEFFLENCPKENALFLYRKKDVVVGMMFLMPGMLKVPADIGESEECAVQIKDDEKIHPQKIYYLYALCVDEKYRGRGIANELLDFAKDYAGKDNAELCLVPGSSNLRKYYAQRGFVDVFVCTEQEINVDTSMMYGGVIRKADIDIEDLIKARTEIYVSSVFLWNADNLDFAMKENAYSGGVAWSIETDGLEAETELSSCLTFSNAIPYIIGDVDGKVLQVRETNLKLPVVYRIAFEYNCDRVRFLDIKEPFENYPIHTVPYAMMADTMCVEEFVKSIRFDKRYINFCFD